ncbi:Succinate-semialdehyde dehydrogenase, mitochondrial, partial [Perkinsus olseni]
LLRGEIFPTNSIGDAFRIDRGQHPLKVGGAGGLSLFTREMDPNAGETLLEALRAAGDGVGLWVAKSSALPSSPADLVQTINAMDIPVWVAGIVSWHRLAERGLWCTGCTDNLGESENPDLQQSIAPSLRKWIKVTHTEAAEEQRAGGFQTAPDCEVEQLGTYTLIPKYQPDSCPEELKSASHIFWGSGSAFTEARRFLPELLGKVIVHGTGPGHTLETLLAAGVPKDRIVVCLNYEEFERRIRRDQLSSFAPMQRAAPVSLVQLSRWFAGRSFSSYSRTIAPAWPYYLAGEAVYSNKDLEVTDKYSGDVVCQVAMASPADVEKAIAAAYSSEKAMASMPAFQRKKVLQHCVERFRTRAEELAYCLCVEAGKPIADSRLEVLRLIDTFVIAAEETTRMYGEWSTMEISERNRGLQQLYKRVPKGAVSMIAPFNFPLNLAAHKIAPAIAVGCPFVLKPASATPLGSLIIGEVLAECSDLPKGAFSIIPCSRRDGDPLTTDDRFKLLSFTGSPSVGWDMKARAGRKGVVLELGGNAACIVDSIPHEGLQYLVDRIAFGAFYQSGQSCISTQRLYIKEDIYDEVVSALVEKVKSLRMGDPKDEQTFIGPMISEKEATRLEAAVKGAVGAGCTVLCGGGRRGAMFEPTLLADVPDETDAWREEAFGPLLCAAKFGDFEEVVERANDSKYGIHVGLFTNDINRAFYAWNNLLTGGLVVNDVPSIRVDSMPYGGVKDSGIGREGVRYAMEDMTEIRTMLIKNVGTSDKI